MSSNNASKPDRPSIFISCVSSEFRAARTKIAETLKFLGYDVEYQDSFSTDAGDLRQLLREKIDACEGLIQIVGDSYGAEPADIDEEFGRVSYTQYELLYARSVGKKTWLFFPTAEAPRDEEVDRLDLAPELSGEEQRSNQRLRQELQRQYRQSLVDDELRWEFASETDLENRILRMRRDLDEIRKEYRQWQASVHSGQIAIRNRLQKVILIGVALIVAIGAGFYWFEGRTREGLEKIVDEGATRFRKTETKDIRLDDLYFQANVIETGIGPSMYLLSIGPANEDVGYLLQQVEYEIEPVGGTIDKIEKQDLGFNASEHHAYQFTSQSPPTAVRITLTGRDGDSVGPFTFDTPFDDIRRKNGQDLVADQVRQSMEQMMTGSHLYTSRPLFICTQSHQIPGLVDCMLTSDLLTRQMDGGLREMRFGETRGNLDKSIRHPFNASGDGIVFQKNPSRGGVHFFVIVEGSELFYQGVMQDGSTTEITPINIESGGFKPHYAKGERMMMELEPDQPASPRLFANQTSDRGQGRWQLVLFAGSEVSSASWTIFEGGANSFSRNRELLASEELQADELGIDASGSAPRVILNLQYADGSTFRGTYAARWSDWLSKGKLANLDFSRILNCTQRWGIRLPDESELLPTVCSLNHNDAPSTFLRDVEVGTAPDQLTQHEFPNPDQLIADYDVAWQTHTDALVAKEAEKNNNEHHLRRYRYGIESRAGNRAALMKRGLDQRLIPWRSAQQSQTAVLAAYKEPADAVYFRFTLIDGTVTEIIRVPVR